MDSLNKIKFKKTDNENWFIKIDLETGGRKTFPKKHGFHQEMLAWEKAGNVIEEAETPEEKKEREAKEAEQSKTAYIGLRQSEYPSFGDQLDYIYHNGVEAWKNDIIKPIKEKYPKPS
jgi:hypothetical protein